MMIAKFQSTTAGCIRIRRFLFPLRTHPIRCILNVTKHSGSPILDPNPFRYCAEYVDGESGQVYLRNRYYDPGTGRFTSEDPIRSGANWYAYCGGNPVGFVDSLGLFGAKSWEWFENAPYSEGYVNQRIYGSTSGSSSGNSANLTGLDIMYNRGNVSYTRDAATVVINAYSYYENSGMLRGHEDGTPTGAKKATDAIAIKWAINEFGKTNYTLFEYGSALYFQNGNYKYTDPTLGSPHDVSLIGTINKVHNDPERRLAGYIHSHPNGTGFSKGDQTNFNNRYSIYKDSAHPFSSYVVYGTKDAGANVLRLDYISKDTYEIVRVPGGLELNYKRPDAEEQAALRQQTEGAWNAHIKQEIRDRSLPDKDRMYRGIDCDKAGIKWPAY